MISVDGFTFVAMQPGAVGAAGDDVGVRDAFFVWHRLIIAMLLENAIPYFSHLLARALPSLLTRHVLYEVTCGVRLL